MSVAIIWIGVFALRADLAGSLGIDADKLDSRGICELTYITEKRILKCLLSALVYVFITHASVVDLLGINDGGVSNQICDGAFTIATATRVMEDVDEHAFFAVVHFR